MRTFLDSLAPDLVFCAGTHRDPFDRMLAAQSQIENIPLVTADPAFKAFGTRVIW